MVGKMGRVGKGSGNLKRVLNFKLIVFGPSPDIPAERVKTNDKNICRTMPIQ